MKVLLWRYSLFLFLLKFIIYTCIRGLFCFWSPLEFFLCGNIYIKVKYISNDLPLKKKEAVFISEHPAWDDTDLKRAHLQTANIITTVNQTAELLNKILVLQSALHCSHSAI